MGLGLTPKGKRCISALESILLNVATRLEQQEQELLPKIKDFLVSLNDYVNQEKLKTLLVYRRELNTFERHAVSIRATLNEILHQ